MGLAPAKALHKDSGQNLLRPFNNQVPDDLICAKFCRLCPAGVLVWRAFGS